MKAVVFRGPGDVELTDIPTPEAGPGEVLLELGSNTVCGTDVRIMRGEKSTGVVPGTVLGHEIAGTVVQVGEGIDGYKVGDLGVLTPVITCGVCHNCMHGLEHFCSDNEIYGYGVDGGLAEYVLVPKSAVARHNLFVAKPGTELTALSLVEPLSCVLNGLDNYKVFLGDTALILGAGPIGLLHQTVIRLNGASQIIVSDPSQSRRDTAKSLGADIVVDPTSEDLNQIVKDATGGRGADVVVIAIGRPQLFADALKLARVGGRVNAFAGFPAGSTIEVEPNLIHYGEITVTGTSNARREHTAMALQLIEEGKIPADVIVSHRFPLSDAMAAIEFSTKGEGIKVAVVPD